MYRSELLMLAALAVSLGVAQDRSHPLDGPSLSTSDILIAETHFRKPNRAVIRRHRFLALRKATP